jgi:hypothetical protein
MSATQCALPPTRKQVDAELWNQSGLPSDLCAKYPEIALYGLYRELDNSKYEFQSYCQTIPGPDGKPVSAAQSYTSIKTEKLKSFLDLLLPAEPDQK